MYSSIAKRDIAGTSFGPRRAGAVWAFMLVALGASAALAQTPTPAPPKTLHYAFRVAETGFDPPQISDLYSRTVAASIFDAPLQWEFLARPVRYRINTLSEMPTVSADFKVFTFKVKPGIYFSEDPAFKGAKRELVAEDYVYSWKRHYDPRWKSPNLYILENAKILGLSELRAQTLKNKTPFDYDKPVDGLRALDKYTFELRLAEPNPRMLMQFTDGSTWGAVAREVVDHYGDKVMEHPVGTGPFVLKEWRRASRIVLERNPNFREQYYQEEAPADDPMAQEAVRRLTGKRLPILDRVEIAIIEEAQPRWLAFVNGEHDYLEEVPGEFAPMVMPNNELAPNLKRQGIGMIRYPRADVAMSYFNMEDPVVGGYTPDKVALRRAMALAVDLDKEIRLARRGQAVKAQGLVAPGTYGFDPLFKSEMGDHNIPKAKALLDLYGYKDVNQDGYREDPQGKPLTIEYATQPDNTSRQLVELWKKNMDAIGIRMVFKTAKWPENLKASTAGKLQMWGVGWSAGAPDGDTFLALGDGRSKGQANKSRFDLPAYNALYLAQKSLPDGPERWKQIQEATRLAVAYMPFKIHVHRVSTDVVQPWVIGYHRNNFLRESWKWIDIDTEAQAKGRQR